MTDHEVAFIRHIYEASRQILSCTGGLRQGQFLERPMVQDACIRQLEIVGEAAKRVGAETRDDNPEIPWRLMAGM